jgi:hypothetical protein
MSTRSFSKLYTAGIRRAIFVISSIYCSEKPNSDESSSKKQENFKAHYQTYAIGISKRIDIVLGSTKPDPIRPDKTIELNYKI